MKKIYLSVLLVLAMFLGANAGVGSLLTVDADTFFLTGTAYPGDELTVTLNATNNASVTKNLKWRYTALNVPGAWETSLCDNALCYSIDANNFTQVRAVSLNAGQSSILKWGVAPNCLAGNGDAQMVIWLEGDSANTAKVLNCFATLTVDASCTLSARDQNESVSVNLYPNPASDFISLQGLDTKAGVEVEVYNMIGKLQTRKIFASGTEPQLNISSFTPGVYMLKVIRQGKAVMTKTFTKSN